MWWRGGVLVALSLWARVGVAAVNPTPPSAILVDAATGEVLRELDADAARPPGALSNLLLLLLSLEEAGLGGLPLDVPVTVSASVAAAGGGGAHRLQVARPTRVPLRPDQAYLLSDLLKAMLIVSADDAAIATAEAIAGSVPNCLELMNGRAQKLGMAASHFATIGGLQPATPAARDTTSARDLARLAIALVRQPQVLQWASLNGLPFDQGAIPLRNVNQLIGMVPNVDGLQVSSRQPGGFSIVATAQRGALRLIAVVLDATDGATRYRSVAELLEWGFAHFERLEIIKQGDPLNFRVAVDNGLPAQVTPVAGQTVSLLRRRDEERDFQVRYQLPTRMAAPLTRFQPLGEVIVEEKGKLFAVIPAVSPEAVVSAGILSAAIGIESSGH
jgi:serine-type D-Ala-D-Ala carboxypeptidase (penicillin-binding protein 5/6)